MKNTLILLLWLKKVLIFTKLLSTATIMTGQIFKKAKRAQSRCKRHCIIFCSFELYFNWRTALHEVLNTALLRWQDIKCGFGNVQPH